jgi:DNA-binding MarR family transcriptional regulator
MVAHSKDGLSAKELAERIEVTGGAITQFVDDLITKDLVCKKTDDVDRRITRVQLTDKTKAIFKKMRQDFFNQLAPMFDRLTDDELETLSTLLSKISKDIHD